MKNYKVMLWPGAGMMLDEVTVEARDPEDALVQASLTIGMTIPADEADPEVEESDIYTYLDRTEYDAGCVYLLIENARIEVLSD